MVTIHEAGRDFRHDAPDEHADPKDDVGVRADHAGDDRAGFSMVEVIMAVLILAVGLLGMAGTTAWVVRETVMADAATERMAARQTVIEGLRARPFDNVGNGTRDVGDFTVAWDVIETGTNHKSVQVVTTGRGMRRGGDAGGLASMGPNVSDTLVFHLVEVQ